jgi:lipid A 3-O-deacylase
MKKTLFAILFVILNQTTYADGLRFGVGSFDFSDKGARASLFETTYHFSDDKAYKSAIGDIKPIVGAFVTDKSSAMAFAGVKADYNLGIFTITPSFTPGFYSKGDGKDLGNILEFKSQINLGLNLGQSTNLSLGYNHISNASLGDKNPGANSFSFNFLTLF